MTGWEGETPIRGWAIVVAFVSLFSESKSFNFEIHITKNIKSYAGLEEPQDHNIIVDI